MADGTAKEFFDTVDKEALAKHEEDRLLAHITKAKSAKEAEAAQWLAEPPKHATGHSPRGGKDILVQWKDPGGATIKQLKCKTDHVFRLPLEQLCSTWFIKNVRYFEGSVPMKTMLDGYADLPLHNKNDDTVAILADPMTDEDKEAFEKAQKEKTRRPSGGPLPIRKLSGAAPGAAPPVRKVSTGAPPPVNAAPARKLSGNVATAPRKVSAGAPPPVNATPASTTPNASTDSTSPAHFVLTDEDRAKREKAEEEAMWKRIGGRPKDQ